MQDDKNLVVTRKDVYLNMCFLMIASEFQQNIDRKKEVRLNSNS
jgi:hypothetical protein